MKISTLIFIMLIAGIFQLTCLEHLNFLGARPDLLLLTAVTAGFFLEFPKALMIAVLAGIFKDAFGLASFGFNIVLFGLWVFLTVKITRKISIEDNLTRTVALFAIALLQNIISGFYLTFSGGFVTLGIFLRIVLLGSLYTSLSLPLILKIAKIRV